MSLARNNISRVEGLEPVAGTLQQLWLSYNNIGKLDGLPPLPQLRVLYLANNLIRDLKDIEGLPPSIEARPHAGAADASVDAPAPYPCGSTDARSRVSFRYARCRSCRSSGAPCLRLRAARSRT